MKKLIFVLAIFIAAPTFAALDVSLVDNGNDTISVVYTGADANAASTMPRAFALQITIDSPALLTGPPTDFYVGECNTPLDERGYGIYPARITIDTEGDVTDWGNPLADQGDPGAGTTMPSRDVVLEFASLYLDPNVPPAGGVLCTLGVNCNGATGSVNIHMVDEDTYRGGLVYEDGSQGDVDDTLVYSCGEVCRDKFTPTEQALYDRYLTEPLCWCSQYQCRGDVDGATENLFIVGDLRVYNADLTLLINNWSGTPEGGANPCADIDHAEENLFIVGDLAVYNADLTLLINNWAAMDAGLTDCPSYIP